MKTELKNIGAWGRMHYDFLYRNNWMVINVMRLNRTLNGSANFRRSRVYLR